MRYLTILALSLITCAYMCHYASKREQPVYPRTTKPAPIKEEVSILQLPAGGYAQDHGVEK